MTTEQPSRSTQITRDSSVVPYISAEQSLPEITVKAFILSVVLAAVLAGANAYLGLKVGMTVSAAIPAAVVSMAILRLFRRHNILENNIVQTAASSGEAVASGVIFTIPALLLLGYWDNFQYGSTIALAVAGGTLGVLFTIPLRRALIIESKLKFPEGIAAGEVLKAGTEGGRDVRMIGLAAIGAALVKLCQTGFKVFAGSIGGATPVGGALFGVGSELSLALLAVGYIVGLNIATVVLLGGVISWVFGIPIYTALYGIPPLADGGTFYDAANEIWATKIRYMGVGAMIVGSLWTILLLVKPVIAGVRSSFDAIAKARTGGDGTSIPRTERDAPITYVLLGIVGMALPIFVVFLTVIDRERLGVSSSLYWATIIFGLIFALIAGFLFSSVAGYLAGVVGSSNSPISGVTIATLLSISLALLVLLGSQIDFATDAPRSLAAAATAILVSAVVCVAAAMAGDNLQDLKAGQLVGATPYKQQIMQVVGVVAGAVTIAPVLRLLYEAYGLGTRFPRAGMDANEVLSAPQATLMGSVAQGVFARNLEWNMIAIGALIAVAIIVTDEILKRRGSKFQMPVLAAAVGIYLPLELTVPIFVGGIIAYSVGRSIKRRTVEMRTGDAEAMIATSERRGLLFASGIITGEALLGILLAVPFAAAQSTDVLRLAPEGFETIASILGVLAFLSFAAWLYRVASRD